ncbi:MAG TPA: hypothetical protein ENI66_00530 [Candidatus Yonathbacteria bacterium]|nr:hypothetical protein [Candidatus Yonathbacteria bacterium]
MTNNKFFNDKELAHFKSLLEAEQERIEKELTSVGRINPNNPKDWEPTPAKMSTLYSDSSEVADASEEFEIRTATEVPLEKRLTNIKEALERIESGAYGICKVGNDKIELDRLEANPAAATCKAHINE